MSIEIVSDIDQSIKLLSNPEFDVVKSTPMVDLYATARGAAITNGADIVVISGPSGAGKDSLLEEVRMLPLPFVQTKTATSRDPRPTESEDAYTWMQQRAEGEDLEAYIDRMVASYGLVEYDLHHGNLYGIPADNLASARDKGVPLVNADTNGVNTLREKFSDATIVDIFICPDSAAMLQRTMGMSRDNLIDRLEVARRYMLDASEIADFIYVNRESADYKERLRRDARAIFEIVDLQVLDP